MAFNPLDLYRILNPGSTNKQRLAGAAGVAGSVLNLPDMGVSESQGINMPSVPTTNNNAVPTSPTGPGGAYPVKPASTGTTNTNQVNTNSNTSTTGLEQIINEAKNDVPQPDDSQINALYDPLFAQLDQTRAAYEQGANDQRAFLTQAQQLAQTNLSNQKDQSFNKLTLEEQDLIQQYRENQAENVSMFNTLQQNVLARFGGRGSAARAGTEIATQQFLKNQGKLDVTKMRNLQELENNRVALEQFFISKEEEIRMDYEAKRLQLEESLRQAFLAIDAQRATLNSEKQERKMQEMQKYRDRILALNNSLTEMKVELELYKAKKNQEYTAAAQQIQDSIYDVAGDVFANDTNYISMSPVERPNQSLAVRPSRSPFDFRDEYEQLFLS